jgi:hypothetical protein
VNSEYFDKYPFNVSSLQAEYLVGWGNVDVFEPTHVAYVISSNGTLGGTYVAQVEYIGATVEHSGYTLTQIINGVPPDISARGNPTKYYVKRSRWSAQVSNSFAQGNVKVADTVRASGWTEPNLHWESTVSLDAVEADTYWDPYYRRFRRWTKGGELISTSKATNGQITRYDYQNSEQFVADLPAEYNVTFQNSLPGASGGTIKVRGVSQSSPYATTVLDAEDVLGEGVYQEISRIKYTFSQWNDASSTNPRTFTPTGHTTYTASYSAKPLPPAYVTAGGDVGDYVHLSWQEHPHTSVTQYQIWRKVKPKNQSEQPPELIATRNRGTTSYIDYTYTVTDGYTDDLVWYDVRAYFSVNGTYSDPEWVAIFGQTFVKLGPAAAVTDGVQAFPNPFNPSTRILFQLQNGGNVSVRVYDIVGREIATLARGELSPGKYSVEWKGQDDTGRRVGSGVYFVRLDIRNESHKNPVTLVEKVLFTK